MNEAKYSVFTTEDQLSTRYNAEIADFWATGKFSHFNGVNSTRVNYAIFHHKEPITQVNKSLANKCLVISPGRSESYLKYKELSFDLFNLGFNLFLIDHRGQGLSERTLENPYKGHVEDFQYYVDDLAIFIENIVKPYCILGDNIQKPYLLAHSMGGAIAARYLQDHPHDIKAAVLSSPMLGFNSGALPEVIAKPLIKTMVQLNDWFDNTPWYFVGHKDYAPNKFVNNILTHSELRFQQFNQLYQATQSIQLGGVTVRWLTESINALETIFAKLNKIKTPTLVIQAGADKVVNNLAQDDFCQQLHHWHPQSCPDGKPLTVKGASHELFFESDIYREQSLLAALYWIKKH